MSTLKRMVGLTTPTKVIRLGLLLGMVGALLYSIGALNRDGSVILWMMGLLKPKTEREKAPMPRGLIVPVGLAISVAVVAIAALGLADWAVAVPVSVGFAAAALVRFLLVRDGRR